MAVSNLRIPAIRLASLLGLLVACGRLPGDVLPDSVDVSVLNPVAWPAGKLFVVSSAFRGRADLPAIRLDTLQLATTRVNDSTVSVDLPDTSGDFQLRLEYRGAERSGSVTLVGFKGRTETVALTGWPIRTAPGSPVLIAAAESNLVRLDLATGSVADLPIAHTATCAISPGPSFRDSTVVAQSRDATPCGKPRGWRFAPTVLAVDSAPYLYAADRLWAELALDTWLKTDHHHLTIYRDGQLTLLEQLEEGERAVLSPDRSRAIVLTTIAPNHVPVLLTAPGTIAFRLPLLSAEAAAFSANGDTLFAAGYSAFAPDAPLRLVSVDAAFGAVLGQVDDSLLTALWDMVLDPDAPWLYGVELTDTLVSIWQPRIDVFDRRTLRFLGRIRPPATATCAYFPCGQVGLAIDRATRTLYAFDVEGWGSGFGIPAAVFRFDLVPTTQVPEILSPSSPSR